MTVETTGSSRVGQQQKSVEPRDLGIGGDELAEEFGEPDRLFAEISSDQCRVGRAGMALGEDRRDHLAHDTNALSKRVHARRTEGNSCGADLGLGAGDSTRHRLLGHEKGTRDLWRREPGHDPQRQGDLCLRREGGVAASDQQRELIVESLLTVEVAARRPGAVRDGRRGVSGQSRQAILESP